MTGYVFGCISGIVYPRFIGFVCLFVCEGGGVPVFIHISILGVVAFSADAAQYPERPYRERLNRPARALDVARYLDPLPKKGCSFSRASRLSMLF